MAQPRATIKIQREQEKKCPPSPVNMEILEKWRAVLARPWALAMNQCCFWLYCYVQSTLVNNSEKIK